MNGEPGAGEGNAFKPPLPKTEHPSQVEPPISNEARIANIGNTFNSFRESVRAAQTGNTDPAQQDQLAKLLASIETLPLRYPVITSEVTSAPKTVKTSDSVIPARTTLETLAIPSPQVADSVSRLAQAGSPVLSEDTTNVSPTPQAVEAKTPTSWLDTAGSRTRSVVEGLSPENQVFITSLNLDPKVVTREVSDAYAALQNAETKYGKDHIPPEIKKRYKIAGELASIRSTFTYVEKGEMNPSNASRDLERFNLKDLRNEMARLEVSLRLPERKPVHSFVKLSDSEYRSESGIVIWVGDKIGEGKIGVVYDVTIPGGLTALRGDASLPAMQAQELVLKAPIPETEAEKERRKMYGAKNNNECMSDEAIALTLLREKQRQLLPSSPLHFPDSEFVEVGGENAIIMEKIDGKHFVSPFGLEDPVDVKNVAIQYFETLLVAHAAGISSIDRGKGDDIDYNPTNKRLVVRDWNVLKNPDDVEHGRKKSTVELLSGLRMCKQSVCSRTDIPLIGKMSRNFAALEAKLETSDPPMSDEKILTLVRKIDSLSSEEFEAA